MAVAKSFLFTLIRHGETLSNRDGIIQGHSDIPLSTKGIDQCQLLGTRLTSETFTHVYSSDLSRAYQTIDLALKVCVGREVTVTTDIRIRERFFGDLEGQYIAMYLETMKTKEAAYSHPTVETIEDFTERAVEFFHEICSKMADTSSSHTINSELLSKSPHPPNTSIPAPSQHVLVGTHGGTIRMFLKYFDRLGYKIPGELLIPTPNTGITSFLVALDEQGKFSDLHCVCVHDDQHITDIV